MNENAAQAIWKKAYKAGRTRRREEYDLLKLEVRRQHDSNCVLHEKLIDVTKAWRKATTQGEHDALLSFHRRSPDELPDGSVIPLWFNQDEFPPFHEMSHPQKEVIRHVWSQGVVYGKKFNRIGLLPFCAGVAVGTALVILTLKLNGVL